MATEFKSVEEREAHEKKMTNYLSLFSFLLVFLVGYYFGMHYAAILAAIFNVLIGYFIEESETPIWKQTWALASPYAIIIAVGVINPAVIPVGVFGVIFTALGLHLKTVNQSTPIKGLIIISSLLLASYGSLVEYPKFIQHVMAEETLVKLPNFKVSDLEGNSISLNDLRGKVIVIDYWATWCKPCRDEFSELENVVKHFDGNENVVFLITNADHREDLKKVQDFAKNNAFQLPFYNDETGNATRAINLNSYPTLILIDKEGNLRLKHEGYSNAENLTQFLKAKIDELIAE